MKDIEPIVTRQELFDISYAATATQIADALVISVEQIKDRAEAGFVRCLVGRDAGWREVIAKGVAEGLPLLFPNVDTAVRVFGSSLVVEVSWDVICEAPSIDNTPDNAPWWKRVIGSFWDA